MTKPTDDLLKTSRRMSYLLRHDPESAGLEMSEYGEVNLQELAKAVKASVETVREIVESDSKGRYVIEGSKIWATQGHSIPVLGRHKRVTEAGFVYHGTKQKHLDSIKKQGLISGDRLHVHLSGDVETASAVAARRKGTSVILKIDGNRLIADGHELLRSSNGVLLSESVPWKYVLEVIPVVD